MWQYNFDYLCHSSHKYIDKIYRNGRWTYIYDDKGKLNRRDTSPNTYANRKADSSLSLNPRALGIVFSGTNPKGHRRTGDADLKNPNTNEAKNARNREIAKSTAATKVYAKAREVVKAQNARQNEINKGMKLSVSRAQDARQNEINKSKSSFAATPKQGLSTKQQTDVNKAVAKSIAYINKTYGTNYGSEAATAAEKERVRRAVEESKDRPARDQNSREAAIARSVDATKTATQLANAKKQEAERRRASNTAERSQSARDRAITKSSQPFDAKKNQHMDALAERAFQKIRSKSVDFDIPNAYINDKGQTAYFTAEERREIALKMFKKFVDDDQTSVSEIRRAKNYIMKNFGVSENLLDTLQENHK